MVYIYILKLENNKYYIGKTDNPEIRLNSHFNLNGSEWTKKYKPIEIIQIIPNCDNYDEDKYTKIYMDKYGINNVRGGSYVKLELDTDTIKFLEKESIGTNDKCFNCGIKGHFAKDCKNSNKYNDPLELVSLNSLIKYSPQSILNKISILDIINKFKKYKIKCGDIILNYYKNEHYNNLQEIIKDAIYIYDNHTDYLDKYKNKLSIDISKIDITYYRIKFYKSFSELLSKLPCEIIKELFENKKTFQEIEMDLIKNLM